MYRDTSEPASNESWWYKHEGRKDGLIEARRDSSAIRRLTS